MHSNRIKSNLVVIVFAYGQLIVNLIDATWLSWSNWEPCSSTCIPSSRVRKRVCDIPKYGGVQLCNANDNQDVETCSATDCTPGIMLECSKRAFITYLTFYNCFPVNGEWIPWTLWTSCSLSCGGGQEIRSRSCSDPAPAFGGLDCPGLEEEALACNTQPCPGKNRPQNNAVLRR